MANQFVDTEPFRQTPDDRPLEIVQGRLADTNEGEESFLVRAEGTRRPAGRPVRKRPLNQSALFREFADVPTEADAIRAWSEVHGPLGTPETIELPDGRRVEGEPLGRWLLAIGRMREVLGLWDAWRRRDIHELARAPFVDGLARAHSLRTPLHPSSDRDEILKLAAASISLLVQSAFERARGREDLWPSPIRVRLDVGESQPFALKIGATSLAGTLWLQLALAIDGDKEYRRCPRCGSWWEVQPDIARTSRVYCSTACRQSIWRSKQPRASIEGSVAS